MKKKILATLVSAYCAVLVGCNSDGGGYKGPVKGDVEVITPPTDPTPPQIDDGDDQASTGPDIGPDKRFAEVSAGVDDVAKYKTELAVYDFGKLVVGGNGEHFTAPNLNNTPEMTHITSIRGWIRYPVVEASDGKKFPVVVFIHGQNRQTDSYQGFDYLAENLSQQGYVVLSIDASEINLMLPFEEEELGAYMGDPSSISRGQLVLGTLDKFKQLDEFGGPGAIDSLRDKLDFENVGMMGHSRGGKTMYVTTKLNTTRVGTDVRDVYFSYLQNKNKFDNMGAEFMQQMEEIVGGIKDQNPNNTNPSNRNIDLSTLEKFLNEQNINFAHNSSYQKPYQFKGAFALAPVSDEGLTGLANVPMATLIPACDGDLAQLDGTVNYDTNRFSMKYDTAPKYQLWMRGANHNYFNSTWKNDDFVTFLQRFNVPVELAIQTPCTPKSPLDPAHYIADSRLEAMDQRRFGKFMINSFMRYFVGGEQQFKAYWNAVGKLPKEVCSEGVEQCDERVLMTVQKNGSRVIENFSSNNAIHYNKLGGINSFTGFDANFACSMSDLSASHRTYVMNCKNPEGRIVTEKRDQGSIFNRNLASVADALFLIWSNPNPVYEMDLAQMDTQGYDSITFRAGIEGIDPGQEIKVEVIDSSGKKASVLASDFTDSLYRFPRPKKGNMPLELFEPTDVMGVGAAETLNMISIPLQAFKGVDTTHLTKLVFTFPAQQGTLRITDIQLQNLRN